MYCPIIFPLLLQYLTNTEYLISSWNMCRKTYLYDIREILFFLCRKTYMYDIKEILFFLIHKIYRESLFSISCNIYYIFCR
jgi:hypothetical protein